MTNAYTIPVAFLVEGETEEDAAKALVEILASKNLTQDHVSETSDYQMLWEQFEAAGGRGVELAEELDRMRGPIESWWPPNHRYADGGDDIEQVLIFRPGTSKVEDADEVIRRYHEGPAMTIVMDALPAEYVYDLDKVRPIVERLQQDHYMQLVITRLNDWLADAGLLRDDDEGPFAGDHDTG
jgi:hypothetical protein